MPASVLAMLLLVAAAVPVTAAAAAVRTAPPGPASSLTISGDLAGAAAISARDAWAVGSASSGKTLIVHWNGKAWKRVHSPTAAGGASSKA